LSTVPASSTLHGIYARVSALVLFSTMDALVKWLGDSYGPFQMMLFRSAIALVPLYFLFRNTGGIRLVQQPAGASALRIASIQQPVGFLHLSAHAAGRCLCHLYAAPLFMVGLLRRSGEVVGWRRSRRRRLAGVLIMLEP
jgi:hypothetical protein